MAASPRRVVVMGPEPTGESRRNSRFTITGQDIAAKTGRGSNAMLAGSFSRVHRSIAPWWTQLDSYPVSSEEDIMDSFVHSAEMYRLEKLALKKFQLEPEHIEILATVKTADAKSIAAWHDKVANFLRHRQSLDERVRARDTLSQRLKQKKSMMIALATEEDEEEDSEDAEDEEKDKEAERETAQEDEEDEGDEASGADDSPRSPVTKVKKSECFKMPPESQADMAARQMVNNRRSSQTLSRRMSSTQTSIRSDGLSSLHGLTSPRQRLQNAATNVLGTVSVVKKMGRRASAGRTEATQNPQGDGGKPASPEAPAHPRSSARGSRLTRFA